MTHINSSLVDLSQKTLHYFSAFHSTSSLTSLGHTDSEGRTWTFVQGAMISKIEINSWISHLGSRLGGWMDEKYATQCYQRA